MTTMETMCVMALITLLNVCCFILGTKLGQKVVRGETVETPKFELKNPIREYNEKKEIKKEEERDRIIAENIDTYNGTPYGQQELPK